MINTDIPLEIIKKFNKNTLFDHLGMEVTKLGSDFIEGTMPVDRRTVQPLGLLHGGASAALIESLGSIGSSLIIDRNKSGIVGLEVNANHIKGVKSGIITGTAKIVHEGRTTHIWQVDLKDENKTLVATGRLTVLIIDLKK